MSDQPINATDRRALLAGIGGLAAGTFLTAGRAEAGPLHPPAAPASTPGPEPRIAINQENTPGDTECRFRITKPGSYYLTGDVSVNRPTNGILIAANNVTIDLMGYSLQGDGETLSGISSIGSLGNFDSICIRNGVIANWSEDGIVLLNGELRSSILLEDVQVLRNGQQGFNLGRNAIIRRCSSSGNQTDGFRMGTNSMMENCHAFNNVGSGIVGGDLSLIANCVVRANQGDGIRAGLGANIISCTAIQQTQSGIVFSTGLVRSCCSINNDVNGIECTFGGRIQDCESSINGGHGIAVGTDSHVFGCSSSQNTGAGINAQGNDIRLEGNNCCSNATGIQVTSAGNFILRNTCSGNTTNWDIAANNKCLVINGTNAPAINGNSGGTSPGSTDPNANYTY